MIASAREREGGRYGIEVEKGWISIYLAILPFHLDGIRTQILQEYRLDGVAESLEK